MTGYALFVSPHARLDVMEAADWYEEQQEGLGGEFVDAYNALQDRLHHNPQQFPRFGAEFHRALFPRFPYALLF